MKNHTPKITRKMSQRAERLCWREESSVGRELWPCKWPAPGSIPGITRDVPELFQEGSLEHSWVWAPCPPSSPKKKKS